MNFATRLKEARESLAYTQQQMAKAASVSVQMWQAYEAGRSVPGGKPLMEIARLGLNVNYLLTGVGPLRFNEEEMKKPVCEEAHEKLRERIEYRYRLNRFKEYNINGITNDEVDRYLNYKYYPTKEQLYELCQRAGSPCFDPEFIEKVTSVDPAEMRKWHDKQAYFYDLVSTGKGPMAEKIKQIRGEMALHEFAKRFAHNEQAISKVETEIRAIEEGEREPHWIMLSQICHEFGINSAWLIENEGPMLKKEVQSVQSVEPTLNIATLTEILTEAEVYESASPGSLVPGKKAKIIAELYEMRLKRNKKIPS
ncbi:helix-turn-helix domain-containing protein [Geomonas propionica]|uniref:Helix-turn-helix transcriptional regulator n=1 Tax=Geomonas propionica TaxID=2798582 RepID=A0ABS0YQH3_9BACT|nr:helix-turn-helix transcriptional regulator [Geomonas propionica]MBJ6800202.1 helix-turn-helix transcriptional regulator [Geomonas propionica]